MPWARRLRPACVGLLLAMVACQDDGITSYRVPKPPASAAPAGARPIEWTLPKGWTEQPPSEMRVGSFAVAGKDGQSADISVVSLAGDAGGTLANVNRWRGQINLPPIAEADLPRYVRKISPARRQMLLVDFVTDDLFIDNKYKKRLVAAIYPRGGGTWFFKMTGEDKLVESLKPSLLKFLETLKFHDGA